MSRIYCGRLQLTAMLPPSRCFGHCRRRCAFGYREGEVEEGEAVGIVPVSDSQDAIVMLGLSHL